MKVKTDVMIKKIKRIIKDWDKDFDQFQLKAYPNRLLAQVQYREQLKTLISTRLLVEEKMLHFNQRVKA